MERIKKRVPLPAFIHLFVFTYDHPLLCRTRVVSPIIDLIDWHTFRYNATQWPVRGVFDWRLDFHWDSSAPQLQREESGSAVEALR